jgi:hypothetical protein
MWMIMHDADDYAQKKKNKQNLIGVFSWAATMSIYSLGGRAVYRVALFLGEIHLC